MIAGSANFLQRRESLDQIFDLSRSRCFEADALHRLAEQLAVLRLVDGMGGGADHLHAETIKHAHLVERSAVLRAVCPPMVGSSAPAVPSR